MTALQPRKTRYQLLREQDPAYVNARWSAGKTVLKWTRENPVPEFKEEELHDLAYEGENAPWQHTPFQICRPDLPFGGKLCDKCQAELDELIATSPPVEPLNEDEDIAFYQIHNQTVDTSEQTIRQEFARQGILVLSPRPSMNDDGDDDPMTNATEDAGALYTTIDAETIGLIELEKKMYTAGPVRSIGRDNSGTKLRMRGYEDLSIEEQKEAAKKYLRFEKKRNRPFNPKRAQAQRQLTRQLNEQGKKATIFALYGIESVPREYYEVDEDPNRLVLHETDMDAHDVHLVVEPIDPDVDPEKDTLLADEYQVLFFLRGHTVHTSGTPWDRAQQLRLHIADKQLHLDGGSTANLWSDHELAETEWDLGVDFGAMEIVDEDWVQELLETTAPENQS